MSFPPKYPDHWKYGVEVRPSIFGGGYDVRRFVPPVEDDPAENTLLETKGTIEEANAEAKDEFRRMDRSWRMSGYGQRPTLSLWGGPDAKAS